MTLSPPLPQPSALVRVVQPEGGGRVDGASARKGSNSVQRYGPSRRKSSQLPILIAHWRHSHKSCHLDYPGVSPAMIIPRIYRYQRKFRVHTPASIRGQQRLFFSLTLLSSPHSWLLVCSIFSQNTKYPQSTVNEELLKKKISHKQNRKSILLPRKRPPKARKTTGFDRTLH